MRVPALKLDQEHNAHHPVVSPTPHLRAPEKRLSFLRVSDFPHDGWDDGVDVCGSPHGAVGFAVAGAAGSGPFGHVLAVDFESADVGPRGKARVEHVHFDVVVHKGDGEVVEWFGERNYDEGAGGEVFEFSVAEAVDGV